MKGAEGMDKCEQENQEYFFITVFDRFAIDDKGWPDYGYKRCWGFYKDKETALQALHENWTDMWEYSYDYALIEGYKEGISEMTGYRQFFKFDENKGGYFEIDEPEGYGPFAGFAFG